MARITVEDCLEKMGNRFGLVMLVAKRAKQLMKGSNLTVETDENGYFELWDLPAGKYRVSLLLPNRTRIRGYKMLATDKTWRQDLQPDNSIPAVITARKHLEMTVGIESIVPGS